VLVCVCVELARLCSQLINDFRMTEKSRIQPHMSVHSTHTHTHTIHTNTRHGGEVSQQYDSVRICLWCQLNLLYSLLVRHVLVIFFVNIVIYGSFVLCLLGCGRKIIVNMTIFNSTLEPRKGNQRYANRDGVNQYIHSTRFLIPKLPSLKQSLFERISYTRSSSRLLLK
jgi:hypothetical protein